MNIFKNVTFSSGLAMFAMFFGAGNITFPLFIGQTIDNNLMLALVGLIFTAVCIPFSGVIATALFNGDYKTFFGRMGKIPGYSLILFLLLLIGPLGGIPRCISLTHSTLHAYLPKMHLLTFSFIACIVIFLSCWKKNKIISLIGYVLTPCLLILLGIIVVKGVFLSSSVPLEGTKAPLKAFYYGLKEGYNTMDLLASFFFSTLICDRIRNSLGKNVTTQRLFSSVLKSCLIGAALLSLVYLGFSVVASNYRNQLAGIPLDRLLGSIGHIVLGDYAGIIVSLAIALTCLTTAIALTAICSEFLQKEIFKNKLSYDYSLGVILLTSCLVSCLKFSGIVALMSPLLQVCYPALLILCFLNILHKLYDIKPIKFPFYATFSFFSVQLLYVKYKIVLSYFINIFS